MTVAVIDYAMGNLHSVVKALEHVTDAPVRLSDDPAVIAGAERVVFPGQGAARDCMRAIDAHGLRDSIVRAAREKPFLGICMGMQVLVEHSEENGGTDCLGLFPGQVRYFGDDLRDASGERLKVPHMGWNRIHQTRDHPLWEGIDNDSRFYFVHSYYLATESPDLEVGHCSYGREFTCAIARDNVFALQSHPEKSADAGLRLLKNFVNWNGQA